MIIRTNSGEYNLHNVMLNRENRILVQMKEERLTWQELSDIASALKKAEEEQTFPAPLIPGFLQRKTGERYTEYEFDVLCGKA